MNDSMGVIMIKTEMGEITNKTGTVVVRTMEMEETIKEIQIIVDNSTPDMEVVNNRMDMVMGISKTDMVMATIIMEMAETMVTLIATITRLMKFKL